MGDRRRSERIFLRVPITVQALDQSGQLFTEETTTVEVNRHGARIGLKTSVRLGEEVRVTNLATGFTALFRICVQCPQSYAGWPEWGIALSAPVSELMSDFWGVVFEDLAEAGQPHISALLACGLCGRQELVSLTHPEYDLLLQNLFLPRVCTVCRTATDWEPAQPRSIKAAEVGRASQLPPEAPSPQSAEQPPGTTPAPEMTASTEPPDLALREQGSRSEPRSTAELSEAEPSVEAPAARPAPPPSEANRRSARRVPVGVPLLIRTSDGRVEETVSRDVSRTGLSFPTSLDLTAGDLIEIVVGHGVTASPTTQEAEVMWRRPGGKDARALAGARFTAGHEREAHGQPAAEAKR